MTAAKSLLTLSRAINRKAFFGVYYTTQDAKTRVIGANVRQGKLVLQVFRGTIEDADRSQLQYGNGDRLE